MALAQEYVNILWQLVFEREFEVNAEEEVQFLRSTSFATAWCIFVVLATASTIEVVGNRRIVLPSGFECDCENRLWEYWKSPRLSDQQTADRGEFRGSRAYRKCWK